jgi:hypothetical protein
MSSDKWAVQMEAHSTLFINKERSQLPTNRADGSTRNKPDFASPWTNKKFESFCSKTSLCLFSLGLCGRKDVSGNSQPLSHQPPPAYQPQKPQTLSLHIPCACLLARIISHYSFECLDRCRDDGWKRKKIYGVHSFDRPADQ